MSETACQYTFTSSQLTSFGRRGTGNKKTATTQFASLRSNILIMKLHSLVKTEANVWENSRGDQWKPETQSRVFICWRILTNFAEVFTTENMFYFFYKIIIFRLNREKDGKRSAYVNLNFFYGTVMSHNLETEPTTLLTSFSCLTALWKHTCRLIKTIHIIL